MKRINVGGTRGIVKTVKVMTVRESKHLDHYPITLGRVLTESKHLTNTDTKMTLTWWTASHAYDLKGRC